MKLFTLMRKETAVDRRAEFRRIITGDGGYDESCHAIVDTLRRDSGSLKALGELLSDEDAFVRIGASWTVGEAARLGVDVSPLLATIARAMDDSGLEVRLHAIQALEYAQKAGADISCAMPMLIAEQFDESDDALIYSSLVIWDAAVRGRQDAAAYAAGLVIRACCDSAGSGDESWLIERAVSGFLNSVGERQGILEES